MTSPTQILKCVAFLIFFISSTCKANFLTTSANFVSGKAVSNSHTTIQPYSYMQCAVKCFEEGRNGRCNVAGYNIALEACYLSVDTPQDVLDVADEMSGVLYMKDGEYECKTGFVLKEIFNHERMRYFFFNYNTYKYKLLVLGTVMLNKCIQFCFTFYMRLLNFTCKILVHYIEEVIHIIRSRVRVLVEKGKFSW